MLAFSQNNIFNIAFGERTSLNNLFELIKLELKHYGLNYNKSPEYLDFRQGDVRHSLANIDKARSRLGYNPEFSVYEGLKRTISWYISSR